MKAIAINGSPRKGWNTDMLLQQALKGASDAGAETELIQLSELTFSGCRSLNVGKSRSFCFADHYGNEVQCCINDVTLIDVWKSAEEQFRDPRLTERFSEEEIQKMKEQYQEMLRQKCPRGMCYFGIEYECSKDFSLQFYSREYLSSAPEVHEGRAVFSVMSLKPDKKTGLHGLPLKGCAIQIPVSPDTAKMPAELFLYLEKIPEWEET